MWHRNRSSGVHGWRPTPPDIVGGSYSVWLCDRIRYLQSNQSRVNYNLIMNCVIEFQVFFKRMIGYTSFAQMSLFFTLIGLLNAFLMWPLILLLYLFGAETIIWSQIPWPTLTGSAALSLLANILGNFGIVWTYELFLTLGLFFAIPFCSRELWSMVWLRMRLTFWHWSDRHFGLRVCVSRHEIGRNSVNTVRIHCGITARQLERIFGWFAPKTFGQLEAQGTDEEERQSSGHDHWTPVPTQDQQRTSQVNHWLKSFSLQMFIQLFYYNQTTVRSIYSISLF